jgi:hypothetical protein
MTARRWIPLLLVMSAPLAAQTPQRVALYPLSVEPSVGPVPHARPIFDSLLAARMRELGFEIVPAVEQERIWNRLRDSIGGYYDTYTGHIIPEKLVVVGSGTRRELAQRFGNTASLIARIVSLTIPFGGGEAKWHGTSQKSGGRGGLAGLLVGRSVGQVSAMSLIVLVQDTAGRRLYDGVGGIQLLGSFEGGRVHRIPAESLFADSARNRAAVRLALDSLPPALQRTQPLSKYRDSTP